MPKASEKYCSESSDLFIERSRNTARGARRMASAGWAPVEKPPDRSRGKLLVSCRWDASSPNTGRILVLSGSFHVSFAVFFLPYHSTTSSTSTTLYRIHFQNTCTHKTKGHAPPPHGGHNNLEWQQHKSLVCNSSHQFMKEMTARTREDFSGEFWQLCVQRLCFVKVTKLSLKPTTH